MYLDGCGGSLLIIAGMFPSGSLAKITAHGERLDYDMTACTFRLVLHQPLVESPANDCKPVKEL